VPTGIGPLRAVAAGHFDIAILVADEDRRRVNLQGSLQFSWSLSNYVNPVDPPAKVLPVNILNANHQIHQGLCMIRNARYVECGAIRLTGQATIRLGPHNRQTVDAESLIVILRPDRFLIQTTAPVIQGAQPLHAQPTYPAGAPFVLGIFAVNANGHLTLNYPYDDFVEFQPEGGEGGGGEGDDDGEDDPGGGNRGRGQGRQHQHGRRHQHGHDEGDEGEKGGGGQPGAEIELVAEMVIPPDSSYGEFLYTNGNSLSPISKVLFQRGSCVLPDVVFSDVGILNLVVHDANYMGAEIRGRLDRMGRFIPDHFDVTVEQPELDRIPGSPFAYSGQPTSATVTIRAENALESPDLTRNYHADLARVTTGSLSISLVSPGTPPGQLRVTPVYLPFEHGFSQVFFEDIKFVFDHLHAPLTMPLRFSMRDLDGVEGEAVTEGITFRWARIRFWDRSLVAGDYMKIRADIEHYTDSGWRTSLDEEFLTLSPGDLAIQNQSGSGTVEIAGEPQSYFGGRIRGGTDPLRVTASSITSRVLFDLDLSESSPLSFLPSVSGRWIVQPVVDFGRTVGRHRRDRVLYETQR